MKDSQLEELLDLQSRGLRGRTRSQVGPDMPQGAPSDRVGPLLPGPESLSEMDSVLTPLMLLARDIARLLLPITLRGEFRRELHRSLLIHARQQQAQRMLDLPIPGPAWAFDEPHDLPERVVEWITQETSALTEDRRWMWGAAAVGSAVSLVGILAYVLSHRSKPAASA
jgi:hypothetical protein